MSEISLETKRNTPLVQQIRSAPPLTDQVAMFDSPVDAFNRIIESNPLIIGIGEFHATKDGPKVGSAIKHFTDNLLHALKGTATEIIIEGLVVEQHCEGIPTKSRVDKVIETIKRPQNTSEELTALMIRSADLGINPHLLRAKCEDFMMVFNANGGIKADKMLVLIKELSEQKAKMLLALNKDNKLIVIYGGAIHNNIVPEGPDEDYSYGPALSNATKGRYVEIDLFVPELIENDPEMKKQSWYPAFKKASSKNKTILINPRPNSYIIIFPRTTL